jgi:hypothetical protein
MKQKVDNKSNLLYTMSNAKKSFLAVNNQRNRRLQGEIK